MDVAVVGGTGAEGFGLSLRLASAGHRVTIGSRDAQRGADAARRALETLADTSHVTGTTNEAAAASVDVLMVTVPFAGTVMSAAPSLVTRPSNMSLRWVKCTVDPPVSVNT